MKPPKMAKKLLSHFDKHNAGITLPSWEVIENAGGIDRIIFDVGLKKGANEDKIFDCARHVQTALQLPLRSSIEKPAKIPSAVN